MLALSKAVQYRNEGKDLPRSLNVLQLTHECIQFYISKDNYNKKAIQEAIQYLESKPMKIRYLTDAGLLDDVLEIHVKSEDYNSAYDFVLRYGKYEQGIRIARNSRNEKMECLFKLYSLYVQLELQPHSIEGHITELLHTSMRFPIIQAELYLLIAHFKLDMDSCQEAIELYKKLKHTPGELEAFNLLMVISKQIESDNTWITNEEILQYCAKANTLFQLFSKDPRQLLPNEVIQVRQATEFHHVRKLLHNQYVLPPHLGYWIKSFTSPVISPNNDIYNILKQHYRMLAERWLNLKLITDALFTAGEGFDMHDALKKSSLIPYKQRHSLKKYTSILTTIVDLNESFKCYLKSTDILIDLYSPLQAINNHAIHRKDFSLLQNLMTVHKTFERKCKVLFTSHADLVTSLDNLFLAWRVSRVANRNITDLQKLLQKHTLTADQFKYIVPHHGSKRHIFLPWIDLCNAVAVPINLRLIDACDQIWQGLFYAASRHQLVRDSISNINYLYIVMIQTTILLSITSYGWQKTFYLPQFYRHVVTTFDLLNVQSVEQRSLLRACKEEFEYLTHPGNARLALSLLLRYLKYLVGCWRSTINILYRSLQDGNEHIIRYCIASIVVIAANLYIARPTSDNAETHRCLCVLFTYLKSSVERENLQYLAPIYRRMAGVRSINDLFALLQIILPTGHNMRIDQIFILDSRKQYLHFEPKQLREYIPIIAIAAMNVDQYLLARLNNSGNSSLPEAGAESPVHIDEQSVEEDVTDTSHESQGLNIDLQIEQKDKFMLLKDNLIENNFCHACGIKIEDVQDKEEAQALYERQRSADDQDDIHDRHIADDAHQRSIANYKEYDRLKKTFDERLALILQVLEEAKVSSNSNYMYVEKATQWEQQISNLQKDTLESSYDWSERQAYLHHKLKVLQECERDLQRSGDDHSERVEIKELMSPLPREYDYEEEILPNFNRKKR